MRGEEGEGEGERRALVVKEVAGDGAVLTDGRQVRRRRRECTAYDERERCVGGNSSGSSSSSNNNNNYYHLCMSNSSSKNCSINKSQTKWATAGKNIATATARLAKAQNEIRKVASIKACG